MLAFIVLFPEFLLCHEELDAVFNERLVFGVRESIRSLK